jgi:proteasome assembly chaperone (PAC2) family protein
VALLEWHHRPEHLDDPVLVLCLDGWIDAGIGAAAALASLLTTMETELVASFDVDTLLDHRARRPVMRIVDGVNTGLTWPEIELRHGRDSGGRDVLFLAGPEPDHQWRAFADAVCSVSLELQVRLVVGLGSFPAPVPHTRPVRLASTATTQDLARRVGFINATIDVPAGVQAALERRFADHDIPAVGLWARVPHYVAAMPYPEASAALVEGLAAVADLELDATELRAAAEESRARIDAMVANNPEHVALVHQLEEAVDSESVEERFGGELPSGDEIAAELEQFLRDED